MSVDILANIKKAEAEAENIIKQSVLEAKQIVAESEARSQKLINEIDLELDIKSKDIISEAEKEAAALIATANEKVSGECIQMKMDLKDKINIAADYIKGRIVNIHVDS